MQTVFSIGHDVPGYQDWQARLLARSHARVGQPGGLTCLVATDGPAPAVPGALVLAHPPANPHPRTGDFYPMYNRLAGLAAWLATTPATAETVCILDPDCMYLAPIGEWTVQRGHPVAQHISYMRPEEHAAALAPHCDTPMALDPVGMPWLLHREDLVALLPRWTALTAALRDDPRTCAALNWVTDMWAYAIAAAECGLRHEMVQLAWMALPDEDTRPMIHYCYPGSIHVAGWAWDKRTYHAWDPVPPGPAEVPAPMQAMLHQLDELAAFARWELGETA